MTLVLLIALLVIVAASATAITLTRRRGRGPELEPPPSPPAVGTPMSPAPSPVEAPAGELTAEQVEEIERALAEATVAAPPAPAEEPAPPAPVPPAVKPSFRDRLGKARFLLAGYLGSVRSREKITDETWDDLEEALIRADVGVETTASVLDELRSRVKKEGISDPEALLDALKADLTSRLQGDRTLAFQPGALNVWLFVGVNGVGKTTTIGKLGLQAANEGRSVIMAAGDTFRAAAADQLQLWAKRVGADLVRGAEGGDPGAVVFDAKNAAPPAVPT